MSGCDKGDVDLPECKELLNLQQSGNMADTQTGKTDLEQKENIVLSVEPQNEPRKSTRSRKLTEKGKYLQMDKLNSLLLRFNNVYECWKVIAKVTKKSVEQNHPSDILQDHVVRIEKELAELNEVYDAYRAVDTPAHDMRAKLDKSISITNDVVKNANSRIQGDDNELFWPEAGSVFASSASSIALPVTKGCGPNSICSNQSQAKMKKAEAQYVATKAVLKIMSEQDDRQEELDALQAKDKQIVAEQELAAQARRLREEKEEVERKMKRQSEEAALLRKQQEENATRKRSVDNLRRELERLERLKQLNAAIAELQVYNETNLEVDQDREPFMSDVLMNVQATKEAKQVHDVQSKNTSSERGMSSDTQDLVKALAEAISANRLPVPEPSIFYGDPLKFNHWKSSFQTLIERKNIPSREKIFFLEKYVGGAAREALEGYFLLQSKDSYDSAWNLLDERYGQPFVIAKAFRDKLYAWPRIDARDSTALRKYVDFLRSCECAMSQNTNLHTLNDPVENQKLVLKLPEHLCQRWNRSATIYQLEHERFPNFSYFVTFLSMEASIACNPVTSQHAIWAGEPEKFRGSSASRTPTVNTKSFSTNINDNWVTCIFCKKTLHSLHKCYKFLEQPVAERLKFVQHEHLCFGCLNPGHQSKGCKRRLTCDSCSGRHPTCLHEDRSDQDSKQTQAVRQEGSTLQTTTAETTSHRVLKNGSSSQTSAIVPVIVSSDSGKEVLVYALLDSQSDSSFILQHVADALDTATEPVKLKLSTMSSRETIVTCQRLKGLHIRGLNFPKKLTVPIVYTREFIPANRSHIPTPETAKAWPHLEHLAQHIAPQKQCEIGLLIGYNCPQALMPREVVCGKENEPFAQRTDLGWSIVSYGDPGEHYGDAFGVSHRIIVKQVVPQLKVPDQLKDEVHYVFRTQIKETLAPDDIMKMLESDFNERVEEDSFSQDDVLFLTKLKDGIKQKADGHFEMPLPFKGERPSLPSNKPCADQRLMCLKRRLKRDHGYFSDYVNFMNDLISQGDAEKVPEQEMSKVPAWFIPHHGVYHPQKPGKIRIVFDCSAKFQNVSLNDHLLTGPELTNTLVGVLCRFRKGPIAIMCDVERMFHQFHVRPEDQDYLRFLWWENGDLEAPPTMFRMKVHLFGAASSPGCANFGLQHLASMGKGKFSQDTIKFIQRNFYVDDGLASVSSETEAIRLIEEARELCGTGKLHLHKFISNSREVLRTIPEEECAQSVRDLDLGEPLMERVLGVQWCVSSDDFQFRITVKERAMTRRGVLATVASIYDPLGFVAPFILRGKQILQQLCQERAGWDEPLPENLRYQWEQWLQDLPNLSKARMARCYLPPTFENVRNYELHHFSDASVTGYGECSYLRAIDVSGAVHCSFVMGKARVTPTKVTTIPRLELSAAVVAARTSAMLRNELDAFMCLWLTEFKKSGPSLTHSNGTMFPRRIILLTMHQEA